MTKKWETIKNSFTGLEYNNMILQGKDFYLSYNPDTKRSKVGNAMDSLINMFSGKDDGGEETALCKDDIFYILNGDFRKEYEKLFPKGFKGCKKFFDSKKKYQSSFSTEL